MVTLAKARSFVPVYLGVWGLDFKKDCTRVSSKLVAQACPTRVLLKSITQDCASLESATQECQTLFGLRVFIQVCGFYQVCVPFSSEKYLQLGV